MKSDFIPGMDHLINERVPNERRIFLPEVHVQKAQDSLIGIVNNLHACMVSPLLRESFM